LFRHRWYGEDKDSEQNQVSQHGAENVAQLSGKGMSHKNVRMQQILKGEISTRTPTAG
jgi:hypothetical protein